MSRIVDAATVSIATASNPPLRSGKSSREEHEAAPGRVVAEDPPHHDLTHQRLQREDLWCDR